MSSRPNAAAHEIGTQNLLERLTKITLESTTAESVSISKKEGSAQPEDKDTVWDAFELEEDITLQEIKYTSYHTYQNIAAAHTLFDYSTRYWSEHYSRSGSAKMSAFMSASSLLDMKPDCLYPSNFDKLIAACYLGHVEILGATLARTHKHDQTITETAMYWASKKGNFEIINALITQIWHGMNVSIPLHPLIVAAEFGCLEVAKLLLNLHKIDPNNQDFSGRDALSWAAAAGNLEVIKLLLESKKLKMSGKDKDQRNAISWAAGGGHYHVVDYLIKINGIGADAEDVDGWTLLAWALEKSDPRTVPSSSSNSLS
ncbi:hypothetical protein EAF00_009598 [Botryotinia globosa]|nr:hypothetical protein EAF00_009598 [Botryotinia globosa]